MKKLKIVLTVLCALSLSMFLFACGDGKDPNPTPGGDTTKIIESVTVTNQLQFTEADTEASWTAEKVKELDVQLTYTDGTTEKLEVGMDESVVKFEGAKATQDKASNIKWGTIGTYTVDLVPQQNNSRYVSGTVTVVIDHAWEPTGEEGKVMCSVDGATKTTKAISDTYSNTAGWHSGVVLGADNQVVKADPRVGLAGELPATSFIGRLDKGMTITLKGYAKVTDTSQTYFYPILGMADIEHDAAIVQRNDNWSIYDAMAGVLGSWKTKANCDAQTGEWPGAEAAEEKVVYVSGTASASADLADTTKWEDTGSSDENFKQGLPMTLTWSYSQDCVAELTWYYPTLGRTRIARVKMPERQFYNGVLHGEILSMYFTEVSTIQNLDLESLEKAELKAGANKDYIENEMLDFSTLSVMAKYKQNAEATEAEVFEVYASTTKVTDLANEPEGTTWINLAENQLTTAMQSFKVVVASGDQSREKLLADGIFSIAKNAVNSASANNVTVNGTMFAATQLGEIVFGSTAAHLPQLTLSGMAATLSDAQKAALNNTDKNHYVAFSVYADGSAVEKFTANAEGTVEGGVGSAVVNAKGTALNVVLALDENTKTVTIKGVQSAKDIVVDVTAVTARTVQSTVEGVVYLNAKESTVTVTYTINGTVNATTAANYRIGVGSNTTPLGTFFQDASSRQPAAKGNLTKNDTATRPLGSGDAILATIAKSDLAENKLKITFTLKPSVTNIMSYNIQLATRASADANWVVETADVVYPSFDFADNSEETTGYFVAEKNVLLYVDGASLYVVTGRAFHNMVTRSNAVRGTLALALNNGANTPAGYKTKLFTGSQDLSYVVGAGGVVTFTNSSPVEGLISGEFVTFGTLDNSKDADQGAFLLIKVDTTKLGYTSSDSYSFELDPDTDPSDGLTGTYYTYNATSKTITTHTYSVEAGAAAVDLNNDGNCALATSRAYEVKEGNNTVFYAGVYETYAGEHTWSEEKNEDGFYACEICGSLKTYKGDEAEPVAAKDTAVPALGENLADTGLTVFFTLGNVTAGDWGSQALVTAEGNMIITLPNLDPWNNTVAEMADATAREKELATKVAGANCYPGGENLFDGAAYDVFLKREDSPRVAISISKTFGINYYLNGVLKVSYPTSKTVGSGSVADVAELFLSLAGRKGFTLNAGDTTPMSNVMMIKAGYDATKIKEIYDAEQPALAAMIANLPAPRAATGLPTAENTVEIGTADNSLGFTGQAPAWTYSIQPGQKIVLKGTMTANMVGTDELNWHTAIMNTFGTTFHAFLRGDNWAGNADLTQGVAMSCNTDGSTLDPGPDGASDADKFWDGARAIFENCNVEFTFDATNAYGNISEDGVCDGTFTMIFKAISKTDANKFYICTATFSLAQPQSWWVKEGQTWDGLTIGLGGEACYIVLNSSEVIG